VWSDECFPALNFVKSVSPKANGAQNWGKSHGNLPKLKSTCRMLNWSDEVNTIELLKDSVSLVEVEGVFWEKWIKYPRHSTEFYASWRFSVFLQWQSLWDHLPIGTLYILLIFHLFFPFILQCIFIDRVLWGGWECQIKLWSYDSIYPALIVCQHYAIILHLHALILLVL
jgi:hypothetical protein